MKKRAACVRNNTVTLIQKNGFWILFFYIIFSSFGACKSAPKQNRVATEFQVVENYNTDGLSYPDENYSDLGSGYYDTGTGGGNDPIGQIKSRVWQLVEIRIGYGLIALDRQQMAYNNLNDVYIIQFTDEGVSGKAAPNRYFAPYERREGKNISIRQIVGTLMASNINIGGLMENEYYWYLQRITRLDLVNGYLELYANPSPNEEIVLRYRPE